MPKPRKLLKVAKSKLQHLDDALEVKLKALYDIETEITKALPKVIKKVSNQELKGALEEHLSETERHVDRLEQSFKLLDLKPAKSKSEAIRGLVSDTEWIIKEKPGKEVLDSMLIGAATHVEHYEISGYSTAIKWARMLGHDDVANLLEETLKEEEMADDKLAKLADEMIDEAALGAVEEEEQSGDEAGKPASKKRRDSDPEEMMTENDEDEMSEEE